MQPKQARLIPGTRHTIGTGQLAAERALVKLEDGTTLPAVVKTMPAEIIAAECFCAILLTAWGVSVPEPLLVTDGDTLLFGSADASYPNLKQRIGMNDAQPENIQVAYAVAAAKLVATWEETPLVIAADEAIDNRDRNLGNILWDGESRVYIDHEQALGLSTLPDNNKLATLISLTGETARIERSAVSMALVMSPEMADHAAASIAPEHGQRYAEYVRARTAALANRVLTRFPKPKDLFTHLPP